LKKIAKKKKEANHYSNEYIVVFEEGYSKNLSSFGL
jgi:hypothetical protein